MRLFLNFTLHSQNTKSKFYVLDFHTTFQPIPGRKHVFTKKLHLFSNFVDFTRDGTLNSKNNSHTRHTQLLNLTLLYTYHQFIASPFGYTQRSPLLICYITSVPFTGISITHTIISAHYRKLFEQKTLFSKFTNLLLKLR